MGLLKRTSGGGEALEASSGRAATDELLAEIRQLVQASRNGRDRGSDRRIVRLRHLAGLGLLDSSEGLEYPEPDDAGLPDTEGLPEVALKDLTPALLRAAILRDGCLIVRGVVSRADALSFAEEIDRAFVERTEVEAGRPSAAGYYEEFEPEAPFQVAPYRPLLKGGIFAADSPKLLNQALRLLEDAGVVAVVERYLGEPPLLSAHKTTLRKVYPHQAGSWHQDASFMGDARALNVWLGLSRCGDEAPGLDIVPRRIEEIVVQHSEMLKVDLARAKAEAAAGDAGIVRPIFEPGDAVLFDGQMLHKTGSDPSMPNPRFALEAWFFGGSAFPRDYAPLAV